MEKKDQENKGGESADKKPEEKTDSILNYINPEVAKQLEEMGFSKNVSEKACLFNNSNIENAVEWISQHKDDPDFEEEAKITVGENSKLTPEEAKIKAKDLQDKMRKIHEQKQKELEEEQERNRVRQVKEMAQARKQLEETETRLYIERQKREKREAEIAKREMLEQLARDKEERFGKKFDPYTQQAVKKEYTKEENVIYYLKAIKTLYPPAKASGTLKTCYTTLRVILGNILKNENEDKFKKVKMTNPNVQERIGRISLAIKTLKELGFEEEGDFMVVKKVDKDLFNKALKYLDDEIPKIN